MLILVVKGYPMPLAPFLALLFAVLLAAGLTVWLITTAGQMAVVIALPVFLIAAAGLMMLRK